jgi:hypothetical protein
VRPRSQIALHYALRGLVGGTAAGLVIVLAIGRYRAARCRGPAECTVCSRRL